ncbi:DUF1127 domain-containing protein [Geminicoccus flavidas]|uniref:DUF1127 domain-containing protein n=1 Tax=Geminicoccus flavidas TaxID=2506407 RepID=UPI00135776E9|nr:DUF1127 domain-containing protein [Geminicoccus flavidas]
MQQLIDSALRQYRAYETRRSLSRLSDRSLADLGMERDLIGDIAAMAAAQSNGRVSLAQIRVMAQEALLARQAEQQIATAPSPLASLLGTPKHPHLVPAD